MLLFAVECTDQSYSSRDNLRIVSLDEQHIESGNLGAVLEVCWGAFYPPETQRSPYLLFVAHSDVPLTRETLRPWLLGAGVCAPPRHPINRLPHLRYGPTPSASCECPGLTLHGALSPKCSLCAVHHIPESWRPPFLHHSAAGEQGGAICRLYQCELADNSFESLLTARRRHNQEELEMHTHVLPLRTLGIPAAVKVPSSGWPITNSCTTMGITALTLVSKMQSVRKPVCCTTSRLLRGMDHPATPLQKTESAAMFAVEYYTEDSSSLTRRSEHG
eukprot:1157340-Pelagomonas_calceolata.AAC.9